MKARHSFRTRRLLDILRIYEAAEDLLLLADSPPLWLPETKSRSILFLPQLVDALSVDNLMARFPMIQKGGCQLVYHRRKSRRSGQVPVADDELAADLRH
ncbi:hypothetical protein Hanom_Chr00s004579g01723721 [Helianthus anomalus]